MKDKKIVFLGYAMARFVCSMRKLILRPVLRSFGNQGAAQAQNLRDSGIPNDKIIVANRADSYAEDAKSKGFNVTADFAAAAKEADGR